MELVEEVSRNLRPSPAIRTAADTILASLTAGGGAFNGLHLRMEDDTNYKASAGGEQVCGAYAVNPLPPVLLLWYPHICADLTSLNEGLPPSETLDVPVNSNTNLPPT